MEGSWWSTPRPDRFFLEKYTRCPLYMMLRGTQNRSGWTWKNRLLRESIPGPSSPYRVAVPIKYGIHDVHQISSFPSLTIVSSLLFCFLTLLSGLQGVCMGKHTGWVSNRRQTLKLKGEIHFAYAFPFIECCGCSHYCIYLGRLLLYDHQ